MSESSEYYEIDKVKIRIIDNAIIFGTILGVISFLLSLFSWQRITFKIGFIFDFITIIIFFTTLIFRNRLTLSVKSSILVLCVFFLAFTDIYKQGIYSDNKVLLILIPFFTYFAFKIRKTVIVYMIMVFLFIGLGVLYNLNFLKPAIDYYAQSVEIDVWVLNILLITIVALVFVIIVNQFTKTYTKLIADLKARNNELDSYRENLEKLVKERTDDLESANERLKKSNDELYSKNQIINNQNYELKVTMNNLKEAHAQLIQAEKMASLGILTAGVAHEINNPLNFILGGYTGLDNYLEETRQKKDEKISMFLSSIKTGVDRATNIVNGLNQFSRSNDTLTEDCFIHSIIDNCLIILHNQFKNRIEISKKYSDEILKTNGNVGKLHQVFLNVISNAIQAIAGSGKITIEVRKHISNIITEISDTGIGISKEDLPKILDPFFTTKEPGMGTGLGLSISYTIIQEHNGKLEVESELKRGTTVKITLPIT